MGLHRLVGNTFKVLQNSFAQDECSCYCVCLRKGTHTGSEVPLLSVILVNHTPCLGEHSPSLWSDFRRDSASSLQLHRLLILLHPSVAISLGLLRIFPASGAAFCACPLGPGVRSASLLWCAVPEHTRCPEQGGRLTSEWAELGIVNQWLGDVYEA